MFPPAADEQLLARQDLLQAQAREVIAALDRARVFAEVGPVLATGSFVSGLMCWPDLDLMVLAGADFSPHDVLRLLHRVVDLPGIVGFDYRDERGPRCPTGETRDERYHLACTLDREGGSWRIDLSLWLHDPHTNVTAWHEVLRDRISADQRSAVLRIKDVWHRKPNYPEQVSGLEIYTAVLEDDVRTPEQFSAWLDNHGLPEA